MSTILRPLPPSEWERIRIAYEECRAEDPLPLPKTSQGIIIAAEDGGKLVGCIGAERTWQVSPLWLDRTVRGNGLAKLLAEKLSEAAAERNPDRLNEVMVTTNRHVELLVYQMGFIPVPGTIWRRSFERQN